MRLSGVVRDTSGAYLAGVEVELTVDEDVHVARTDDAGRYAFDPLPRGEWFARVEFDGHMRVHEDVVPPETGDEFVHDFRMAPYRVVVVEWDVEGGSGGLDDLRALSGEPLIEWNLHGAYTDPCEWTDREPEVSYRELIGTRMFDVQLGAFPPGVVVSDHAIGTLTVKEEPPIWVALVANRRVLDCALAWTKGRTASASS